MTTEQEVWIRAWCAVAGAAASGDELGSGLAFSDAMDGADQALKEFRRRWTAPEEPDRNPVEPDLDDRMPHELDYKRAIPPPPGCLDRAMRLSHALPAAVALVKSEILATVNGLLLADYSDAADRTEISGAIGRLSALLLPAVTDE